MLYVYYVITLILYIIPSAVCSTLPVRCPTPFVPPHGCKDGSLYHYPNIITYTCFPGYWRVGARVITCQNNGFWTASPPTCMPCPTHTYKEEGDGTCTRCPRNTHTVTMATTSRLQCLCNPGYYGPPGGPCIEIICQLLEAPANGTIGTCDNKLGSTCIFDCDPGYAMSGGSSMRTCQRIGWDGQEPICSACPINTYKRGRNMCLACPPHTATTANTEDGCVCTDGFTGPAGGPCTDINECLVNNGKGPCEDTCVNTIGSYRCGCIIPGYIIDPQNPHRCLAHRQCTNLTQADAPDHGGLVCHWFHAGNSQQCAVKCNPGYDFMSRIDDYEFCGPRTDYVWSFRRKYPSATFTYCIEEFLPDYQIEARSNYFVSACQNLNYSQEVEVKANFTSMLNEHGACNWTDVTICNATEVNIICGNNPQHRRKRDVDDTLDSVEVRFETDILKVADKAKDCRRICEVLNIAAQNCDEYCMKMYKRYLRSAGDYVKRKLQRLYRTRPGSLSFTPASRTFQPVGNSLSVGDVIVRCPKGMESHGDTCVPCNKGWYLGFGEQLCSACPIGTFQPLQQSTACKQCPIGTTTTKHGATACSVCPEGTWGYGCKAACDCKHGRCDPRTGSCICQSGWEGLDCNTDIPGCDNNGCYANVTCTDVPAPGIGYICGACPVGYTGDGSVCLSMDI